LCDSRVIAGRRVGHLSTPRCLELLRAVGIAVTGAQIKELVHKKDQSRKVTKDELVSSVSVFC